MLLWDTDCTLFEPQFQVRSAIPDAVSANLHVGKSALLAAPLGQSFSRHAQLLGDIIRGKK
jgi:hypothetical protein